jgi:putative restriction endonuclease
MERTLLSRAEHWLNRIAKLHMYKAKGGLAPHKPLLLLVVLEMAEQGLLPEKSLPLTPELAFRFYSCWGIVAHRRTQRPDVRFPFHHLQSDGFWSAMTEDGKSSPDDRLTRRADLDPEFRRCAADPAWREQARRVLIGRYFEPRERVALCTLAGLRVPDEEEIARDARGPEATEARQQGREARFRLSVVAAYDYTCALTGYRLTTVEAGSIVDAAHIHQFADSRNNDPRNGLALCKNAHWLFDNGLWTLSDDYCVLVAAGRFVEHSPDQRALADYQGSKIRLPRDSSCWPDPKFIAWHRKNRFQG